MFGGTKVFMFRSSCGSSPHKVLPHSLLALLEEQPGLPQIIRNVSQFSVPQRKKQIFRLPNSQQNVQVCSHLLSPHSPQYTGTTWVSSSGITSYQQELTKMNEEHARTSLPDASGQKVAMEIVKRQLVDMVNDIHKELDAELHFSFRDSDSELSQLSKYYFDGQGKAIRPVIALTLGHAFNQHLTNLNDVDVISTREFQILERKQRQVSIISEMIHTASLVHDDVLDKADTRRGKAAVNQRWDGVRSAVAGDYMIAVACKLLAQTRNDEVVKVMAQVLADLVKGEFQQLQTVRDEEERFKLYLNKSFNKTASLMAYSCKANAILSFDYLNTSNYETCLSPEEAYQYGRNLGIAFQLVDDLLDFRASSSQLGKPAAADLKLGLATAPVLFASTKFPELEPMIARRFSHPGDVETAFKAVFESDGLERTKYLATKHCKDAIRAIEPLTESVYKNSLIGLTETVLNRMN